MVCPPLVSPATLPGQAVPVWVARQDCRAYGRPSGPTYSETSVERLPRRHWTMVQAKMSTNRIMARAQA